MHWAARQILWKLNRFKPTHILLRNSDLIGREILIWANRRRIPTAVITAMRFDPALRECRRFCQLANDDNVMLVANHLPAATASMTHAGLRAGKAIAYDFPPSVNPGDFESKRAPAGREMTLLFVGVMSEAKGVLDFLRAGERLRKAGRSVNLTFLGDGPARPTVVAHPGIADKWITSPGRVGHDEVLKRMRESEILVVPSRPTFAEGMPFVIAEGLAVRTPLVVSDHPIFVQYFREGQGVRFYPAGDDAALADRIVTLLDDPEQYEQLSRASADAWASFQVDTKFHHLLERLSREWAMS
jgi:glycosyltransferase involved in cell wall biosynthesis